MPAARTSKAKAAQTVSETPEVRPPEEFKVKAKPGPPKPPEGMYPEGTELFSYTSKATGETIWFPMKFEEPSLKWVWNLYDKPYHVVTWEWMKQAQIPREMQSLAVDLMDDHPDEYLDLFNKWFEARGVNVTPGE
jgi:hypothetical protein